MMRGQDPDLASWRRAQGGDEAAFEQLRRKYRPLVSAEVRKRVGGVDGEDLEDIAQQVWLAVWRSLPGFRGDAAFCTWVVGVAKNVVFEWIRRRKPAEQGMSEAVEEMAGDEPAWEDRLIKHLAVHEAVKNLTQNERAVIHLRFVLQLTDGEIAQRLGLPLGTVKSRIRAALSKLQASLQGIIEQTGEETEKCQGRRA